MILYEYKCSKCSKIFESFEKTIKDARRMIDCPDCGHESQRVLSTITFKVNGYNESNGYANAKP